MNNLKIKGSKVELAINDDPEKVISFDPSDVGFTEQFYDLLAVFDKGMKELEAIKVSLQGEDVPHQKVKHFFTTLREMCEAINAQIDVVFGQGTSQKAFDGYNSPDMIAEFMYGVVPYLEETRKAQMSKYTAMTKPGVMK